MLRLEFFPESLEHRLLVGRQKLKQSLRRMRFSPRLVIHRSLSGSKMKITGPDFHEVMNEKQLDDVPHISAFRRVLR